MKKFAWFKHHLSSVKRLSSLIDHEGKRGSGMARKLHRICQTIGKKLIENYQTTDKELPNNLETLCKNKEKENNDKHLNISNKERKLTLARVRVDKIRVDKMRIEKTTSSLKRTTTTAKYKLCEMPCRLSCNPSLQMPHPGGADATPERGKCHTWTSVKCGIGPAQMWHLFRSSVASRTLNPVIARRYVSA